MGTPTGLLGLLPRPGVPGQTRAHGPPRALGRSRAVVLRRGRAARGRAAARVSKFGGSHTPQFCFTLEHPLAPLPLFYEGLVNLFRHGHVSGPQ